MGNIKGMKATVVSIEMVAGEKCRGYSRVKLEDLELLDGENLLTNSFIIDGYRKIMGRTLTLIDASIDDKGKNKGMKDIIRGIFSDELEFVSEWGYDQEKLNKMAVESFEEAKKNGEVVGNVSIEDAMEGNIK